MDIGGLTKEFLTLFMTAIISPDSGMFVFQKVRGKLVASQPYLPKQCWRIRIALAE